jgi:prepilin peptidase CpaA
VSFPPIAIQICAVAVVLAAAWFDARERRIPNLVVLLGLILGFGLNTFLYEWQGMAFAAKGFGLALLIYFPLFLLRAMGAGDAKLMAALGSLFGASNWFGVFLLTAMLGGLAGVAVLLARRRLSSGLSNVGFLVSRLIVLEAPYMTNSQLDVTSSKALRMPHGVIILGGVLGFLWAAWTWAPKGFAG